MSKHKNTFIQGKLNRDIDERLLPKGQYPNALNVRVVNSDGADIGAVENVLGNVKLTEMNLTGAKTIGALADGTNNLIYFFVTSDTVDRVVEYDEINGDTVILLESPSGGILNFSANNLVTGVAKVYNGVIDKDLLVWSDNFNPPRIINIASRREGDPTVTTEDSISLIKRPPSYAPTITLTNTLEAIENNIDDKFLSFAFRYKYEDGYYSALSSFSNAAFAPKNFSLDYQTQENLGMVNAFNAVDIEFNTGGSQVTDIEVVFKASNSSTVSIVETFNKEENGWNDNEAQSFVFANNKSYTVLPSDELLRTYDNVPKLAKALEVVGNRLVFGNYVEGYDIVDENGDKIVMDYTIGVTSNELSFEEVTKLLITDTVDDDILGIAFADGPSLLKGGRLQFDIRLTSSVGDGAFNNTFDYILQDNYSNAQDLAAEPDFINFVEEVMSQVFENLVTITTPADTIATTYGDFELTSGTNSLFIQAPTIFFDVDPGADETYYFAFSDVTTVRYRDVGSDTTMKTNRSYELGIIYLDEYNRATTVQTTTENTVFVPQELSTSQNKITAEINHAPPVWADRYKFVLKQNKGAYTNIYVNDFYEDGLYRWVKLEGQNRDKVKAGDTLIVKSDFNGPIETVIKTRVLEVTTQESNFILFNTDETSGEEIIERSGLYMKIKPIGFNMDQSGSRVLYYNKSNTPLNASGQGSIRLGSQNFIGDEPKSLGGYYDEDTSMYVDYPLTAGARIDIELISQQNPNGGGGERVTYARSFVVQGSHDNFQDWFEAEVVNLGINEADFDHNFSRNGSDNQLTWNITADTDLAPTMIGTVNIRFSQGDIILETEADELTADVFYETEQTFDIIDGFHQGNTRNQTDSLSAQIELNTFNAYAMGNGGESYTYLDSIIGRYLDIDTRPTATSVEEYTEIRRFADMTYSEPYVENSGINGLNEFNLSRVNYKDNLDKSHGPIEKLFERDTDIVVFQEDKVSKVLFGKDLIMNADGTSNVTASDSVLGQQVSYVGAYGISGNPESFSFDAQNIYFTDTKRGAVMRLGLNGLTEISIHGMTQFFKNTFRSTINKVKLGAFDPYYDQYILHMDTTGLEQGDGVSENTISFDDRVDGWTSFHSFNPDYMLGMNNKFFTWFRGDLYEHHRSDANRNEFYGTAYPSKVSVMANEAPSNVKTLKAISLEGSSSWDMVINAFVTNEGDSIRGTIAADEFLKKEGMWYAHTRRDESVLSYDSKSTYGVGIILTALGTSITVRGGNQSLTVGDQLLALTDEEATPVSLGAIINYAPGDNGDMSITLSQTVDGSNIGSFIVGSKNPRIEGGDLRGYTFRYDLTSTDTAKSELFAVNSELNLSNS